MVTDVSSTDQSIEYEQDCATILCMKEGKYIQNDKDRIENKVYICIANFVMLVSNRTTTTSSSCLFDIDSTNCLGNTALFLAVLFNLFPHPKRDQCVSRRRPPRDVWPVVQ